MWAAHINDVIDSTYTLTSYMKHIPNYCKGYILISDTYQGRTPNVHSICSHRTLSQGSNENTRKIVTEEHYYSKQMRNEPLKQGNHLLSYHVVVWC